MAKKKAVPKLFQAKPGCENTTLNWRGTPFEEFGFIAEAFHTAARTLVATLDLDTDWPVDDFHAYPIVFLYRHAAELYLKGSLLGFGVQCLKNPP